MNAIYLEELETAQASDMWCQDMLLVMEGTGDTPGKKEFR
jgi:hypothetical protein